MQPQPPGPSFVAPAVDPVTVASPVVSVTRIAPARVSFAGAAMRHIPLMHDAPPVHALPQVPQFAASVEVSVHVAPHIIRGAVQLLTQLPPMHI